MAYAVGLAILVALVVVGEACWSFLPLRRAPTFTEKLFGALAAIVLLVVAIALIDAVGRR